MPEPDTPYDTVLYEPRNVHATQGYNFYGDVRIGNTPLATATAVPSGQYMLVGTSPVSSGVTTDGLLCFVPFDFSVAQSIQSVFSEVVTTPGGAGSVVRMGVYADDGAFRRPAALIADFGTQVGTSNALLTFPAVITLGPGRVWFCVVTQGAPTPNPTMRNIAGAGLIRVATNGMTNVVNSFLAQASVSGALPANASATTYAVNVPSMAFRAA